jgi:small neutral amino acid transporter SnatA (MarC family)
LKFLGKDGTQAISRIMGLLIGAVAIKLIREGIFELIQ